MNRMNQGIITQTVKYGVKSTKNRASVDGLAQLLSAAVKIPACHFCGFQLYFLCFGRWAPRNRSLEPCQDGNVAALRGSFYVTWIHLAPKFFYYLFLFKKELVLRGTITNGSGRTSSCFLFCAVLCHEALHVLDEVTQQVAENQYTVDRDRGVRELRRYLQHR